MWGYLLQFQGCTAELNRDKEACEESHLQSPMVNQGGRRGWSLSWCPINPALSQRGPGDQKASCHAACTVTPVLCALRAWGSSPSIRKNCPPLAHTPPSPPRV